MTDWTISWEQDGAREILNSLCFLALPGADKLAYLPAAFEPTLFSLADSDFETSLPLRFMSALAIDDCRRYTGIPEADAVMACVSGLLECLLEPDDGELWRVTSTWSNPDAGIEGSVALAWDALAMLARQALGHLGVEPETPRVPCEELLNQHLHWGEEPGWSW